MSVRSPHRNAGVPKRSWDSTRWRFATGQQGRALMGSYVRAARMSAYMREDVLDRLGQRNTVADAPAIDLRRAEHSFDGGAPLLVGRLRWELRRVARQHCVRKLPLAREQPTRRTFHEQPLRTALSSRYLGRPCLGTPPCFGTPCLGAPGLGALAKHALRTRLAVGPERIRRGARTE